MKEKMYFVVAGTFREYQDFVTKKLKEFPYLTIMHFKFVRDVYSLMGLSKVSGFYVGTYEQREDIEKIKQMIYIIKCKNEIIKKSEEYKYD